MLKIKCVTLYEYVCETVTYNSRYVWYNRETDC